MMKVKEVLESDFGRATVVQHDVGDAINVVVAGNSDHGHGKVEVPGSVDGDEAID